MVSLFPQTKKARGSERGSTLTGYSLTVAALTVVSLGAISGLNDSSDAFLTQTGSNIGAPRESAFDLTDGVTSVNTPYVPPPAPPGPPPPPSSAVTGLAPITATDITYAGPVNIDHTDGFGFPDGASIPSYYGSGDVATARAAGHEFSLTLDAEVAGNHRIEAEIHAPDGDSDSFWVIFEQNGVESSPQEWRMMHGTPASVMVHDGTYQSNTPSANPFDEYYFDAGPVTIIFVAREPGTFIQNIELDAAPYDT